MNANLVRLLRSEDKNETLDQRLTRLIAEREGVRPEEITTEFIRKKREERLYPSTRYDSTSEYGGYSLEGLTVLTRDELRKMQEQQTQWVASLS